MILIQNPVLRGFHPDPAIVRVAGDYYLATSTFEWFPGVRLHHSRDLVHWRALGYALDRSSQIDLHGSPRSGGVWAPCLSHHDGLFYLVYTDVKAWGHGFVDSHNYLVTAPRIEGPWSDPVYLNSSGFDPSLFHDEDGRKWLVNMVWDHRPRSATEFYGIALEEYDPVERKLVGGARIIFKGSGLGCTEGPHLYRQRDRYYLILAEGGTSWDHAVTVTRSSRIEGPYETDPEGPLLTSRHDRSLVLQKAGHASLVETQNGELYIAHLCGRPLGAGRCVLGRETALERVRFTEDGWIRLDNHENGKRSPAVQVPAPDLTPQPFAAEPARDHFDGSVLGPHFQTLRSPPESSWLSLDERPGFLRLRGRESLRSLHRQSLVARRVQAFRCRFETALDFEPQSFQTLAGLVCFYDDENFYYAYLSHDEAVGRSIGLLASKNGKLEELLPRPIPFLVGRLHLRAEFDREALRFWFGADGCTFHELGPELDATTLSDEHTTLGLGFTGAFGAIAVQDTSGGRREADFDYFEYRELE
jgi:xylan 1,4-beta-xylosidase